MTTQWRKREDYGGMESLANALRAEGRPDPVDALAGEELTLYPEDGSPLQLHFINGRRLEAAGWLDDRAEADYEAVPSGDGLLFIDWQPRWDIWVGAVIDQEAGRAALVRGEVPPEDSGEPFLRHAAVGAAIGESGAEAGTGFPPADLSPRRFIADYGDAAWEQIYLSDRYMAWHGLHGPSEGLVDGEPYRGFHLGGDRYLISFAEQFEPMMVTLVLDFERSRGTGALFAFNFETGEAHRLPEAPKLIPVPFEDARAALERAATEI